MGLNFSNLESKDSKTIKTKTRRQVIKTGFKIKIGKEDGSQKSAAAESSSNLQTLNNNERN